MIRLRSPLIFSLHIRPKSLNWEQDKYSAIQRHLNWIRTVEWECTMTCDSHTARQEALSPGDWPVTRVLKGRKQLPFEKCRFVCLCDKYCVNAVARNPDHWISARSAEDFPESGCILKFIVWVLDGWRDRYDQGHMSLYNRFWSQGALGKNPMVGWDV